MYQIKIKRKVEKVLAKIPLKVKTKIAEKIYFLGLNPSDDRLDIKALTINKQFRLRVGGYRIIYSKDDKIRIIHIEKIKPRGDVYK